MHPEGSPYLSTAISLSTGSSQGCVLSPLLYTLYTHDRTPAHHSHTIVKFTDDTTVVGLISGEGESAYRDEVERLAVWCQSNNLLFSTAKTMELIVAFRKNKNNIQRLIINRDCVERVSLYHCTVEGILSYRLCALFSSCTVTQREELQWVIPVAQRIVDCPLPSLEELHSFHCLRNTKRIFVGFGLYGSETST